MTIRTEAQLNALFADNTDGDIGADDLRDFVETVFQTRTRRIEAIAYAPVSLSNSPDQAVIGATSYLDFAVNDQAYFQLTLPDEIKADENALIQIEWAPVLAEASKLVSWELSYVLLDGTSLTIDTIDNTLTAVDETVPAAQWENASTQFTIPSGDIDTADHEINLRLKRAISGDDGGGIAVHHVFATISTDPPGAS